MHWNAPKPSDEDNDDDNVDVDVDDDHDHLNLFCGFVSFWRPFDNIKLTQKWIFKGKIVTILR